MINLVFNSNYKLNIIEAIHVSAKKRKTQKITSKCEKPKPFTSKEINAIIK